MNWDLGSGIWEGQFGVAGALCVGGQQEVNWDLERSLGGGCLEQRATAGPSIWPLHHTYTRPVGGELESGRRAWDGCLEAYCCLQAYWNWV